MDLQEAYSVLGITKPLKGKELTKIYRAKMKLAHPDAGGNDEVAVLINAAYEFMQSYKPNIIEKSSYTTQEFYTKEQDAYYDKLQAKKPEGTLIIPLNDYCKYLSGEVITCQVGQKSLRLQQGIQHNYRIIIKIDVLVEISTEQKTVTQTEVVYGLPRLGSPIECRIILLESYPEEITLALTILDKTYKLTTHQTEIRFNFNFFNCNIALLFARN